MLTGKTTAVPGIKRTIALRALPDDESIWMVPHRRTRPTARVTPMRTG